LKINHLATLIAGSILVNFELVASDDVTAAQLSEAYQDLVVFLERGLLRLVHICTKKITNQNDIILEANGTEVRPLNITQIHTPKP
jgi:hypothetical protein